MRFALACLLIFFLLPIETASAIQCRTSSAHDGEYWQYRLIDGRRCWYQGERRLAKTKLHWGARGPHPNFTSKRPDAGGGSARRTTQAPVVAAPPLPPADIERQIIIWFDMKPATDWPATFSARFGEDAFAYAPADLEEIPSESSFGGAWWFAGWAALLVLLVVWRQLRVRAQEMADYLAMREAMA